MNPTTLAKILTTNNHAIKAIMLRFDEVVMSCSVNINAKNEFAIAQYMGDNENRPEDIQETITSYRNKGEIRANNFFTENFGEDGRDEIFRIQRNLLYSRSIEHNAAIPGIEEIIKSCNERGIKVSFLADNPQEMADCERDILQKELIRDGKIPADSPKILIIGSKSASDRVNLDDYKPRENFDEKDAIWGLDEQVKKMLEIFNEPRAKDDQIEHEDALLVISNPQQKDWAKLEGLNFALVPREHDINARTIQDNSPMTPELKQECLSKSMEPCKNLKEVSMKFVLGLKSIELENISRKRS